MQNCENRLRKQVIPLHRKQKQTNMKKMEIHEHTKVLVSAEQYDFSNDKRLLIPFTSGEHIGFLNHNEEVVVQPKYIMYYGDCYSENDYIKVAVAHNYGFSRTNGNVSAYSKPVYGLINHKGEVILEPENYSLLISKNSRNILLTIQNKNGKYGVINIYGEEIIPFGKYDYIDGFDRGIARVKIGKQSNGKTDNGNLWGVINEDGIEILPLAYKDIWNFYGKEYDTIIVEDSNCRKYIPFKSLTCKTEDPDSVIDSYDYYKKEEQTYNEYNGSYAQDVMGFSDETIGDAFDGDPDAYWNID